MANAADYLILTQNGEPVTQVLSAYKLRTRATSVITFTASNIAPNYTLSVIVEPNLEGVMISPNIFTLPPNESTTIAVSFDTTIMETLPAGVLDGALEFTVTATPIIVPKLPIAPPPLALPEAPPQIISRVEIAPSSFIFSVLGETKQLQAILYVDDEQITENVTFTWRMTENLGDAFSISETGIVKAERPGVFSGVVSAKVTSPSQYANTVGLCRVGASIPVIVTENAALPSAKITINISGLPTNVLPNIKVTGIAETIQGPITLDSLSPGNYTITPNTVNSGGENYIPSGGGAVNIQPGEERIINIQYTLQTPIDDTSIQIVEVRNSNGKLLDNARVIVGENITVVAQTYKAGIPTNIGPIQFNVSNTSTGTQIIPTPNTTGVAEAVFNIIEAGEVNISVSCAGKVVTGKLIAVSRGRYTIKINAPSEIFAGQCTMVSAIVYDGDTPLNNIPVELRYDGMGIMSDTPCGSSPQTVVLETPSAVLYGAASPSVMTYGGSGGATTAASSEINVI